ncbi:MAG: PqqD family protein [Anderseniella sp.]
MKNHQLTSDTAIIRTNQLPSAELGPDDTVLLDAERGVYFGLEGPARAIWDLLEHETTLATIVNALTSQYNIDAEQCETDTQSFIEQLLENGLVTLR